MNIDGQITILINNDGMMIELHDKKSSITFAKIELNREQVCKALSRLSNTPCEKVEIFGLDKLGKTMEVDTIDFELPEDTNWKNRTDIAMKLAIENTPEGWESDSYFGSQNSFFERGGKTFARTNIRRWIEE